MKAKDILLQYKEIKVELKTLYNMREDIVKEEALPPGIDYSADRVQTSPDDGMLRKIITIQKRTAELDQLIEINERKAKQVLDAIESMPDKTQSRLLYLRYIRRKEWVPIASDLGFSEIHTRGYLHGNALRNFEKCYKEKGAN